MDGFKKIDDLKGIIISALQETYEKKEVESGTEVIRYLEKVILLQVIDAQWKDHLLNIDHLKEGIGLRGYAQKDPLVEYKKEAFELFAEMSDRIKSEALMRLYKIQVVHEETEVKIKKEQQRLVYNKSEGGDGQRLPSAREQKVGRNEPCPCGSGKKYKKCCAKT
jgi:preprotein translocase subunit SecA